MHSIQVQHSIHHYTYMYAYIFCYRCIIIILHRCLLSIYAFSSFVPIVHLYIGLRIVSPVPIHMFTHVCAHLDSVPPFVQLFHVYLSSTYLSPIHIFIFFAIRLCLSLIWASFLSEHILFLLSTTWYLDRSAFHLWPVYQQCLYSICAYILSVPSFHLCVTVYIPSMPIFHIMPLYHIFVYSSFAYIPYNANIPSMCIFHICLYSI